MRSLKTIFLLVTVLVCMHLQAQEKPNIDELLVKYKRSESVTEGSPASNFYEIEVTIKNPHLASKFVLTVKNVESQQVLMSKPVGLVAKNGKMFYSVDDKEFELTDNKAVVRIDIGVMEFDPLMVEYQLYDLQNNEMYR